MVHAVRMDEALAADFAARMERDQAARAELGPRPSPEAIERLMAVDRENTAWLLDVLDRVGWPGVSLVGESGARAAWLLAQHASQTDFQRHCLTLLAAAVEAGEAEPSHLAYLTDRVRSVQGQAQVYGTQFWRGPGGTGPLVAQPIEDEEHLDGRRAAVGLGPFAEYEAEIRAQHEDH